MRNRITLIASVVTIAVFPDISYGQKDLAREKEVVCAAFAKKAEAMGENLGFESKGYSALFARYSALASNTYVEKKGVSKDTLNSAFQRALDNDAAEFEKFVAEAQKTGAEPKVAVEKYMRDRRSKLGC